MQVTVHYLFSKNNKIGSKIIANQTNHLADKPETSHISIMVHNRWIFESTLSTGVRVIPFVEWIKINEIVDIIPCEKETREYSEIKSIYKEIQNKKYDYAGILYLGFYIALNRYFGIKIPKKNKLQSDNKYFCCEAVEKLTGLGPTSMKTPIEILAELG